MIEIVNKAMCCGCSACAQSCPKDCIDMIADVEGFFYPSINKLNCIDCKLCEKVCPSLNSYIKEEYNPQIVGAKAKDNDIRYWSSSGGIFTLLAENIIKKDGVVFGVQMSDDCKSAKHIKVNHIEDLKRLRGSKYIQSRIENAYIEAQKYLEKGKPVLFTGTPCQIAGLNLFLHKEYKQLYCVELICKGVPSEKLWGKYLNHIEQKYKRKVKRVSFRSKKYCWRGIEKKNSKNNVFKFTLEDSFFRMFNSPFSMRTSCYDCKSKGSRTMSDMTIGDFWGVEKIFPNFNKDDKGVSMVLMNTNKGQILFDEIKEDALLSDSFIDYETAKKCNPMVETSIKESLVRSDFFDDIEEMSFSKLEKKYVPMGPRRKLRFMRMKIKVGTIVRGTGVLIEFE